MIDSVDMLWDRALIMQGGTLRADLSREALEGEGKSLEEIFFALTEGTEEA